MKGGGYLGDQTLIRFDKEYSHLAIPSFCFWDILMWACNVVIVNSWGWPELLPGLLVSTCYICPCTKKPIYSCDGGTHLYSRLWRQRQLDLRPNVVFRVSFSTARDTQKSSVLKNRNKTHLQVSAFLVMGLCFDVELNCIYTRQGVGYSAITHLGFLLTCFIFIIVIAHKRNTCVGYIYILAYHMDQTGHLWSFI